MTVISVLNARLGLDNAGFEKDAAESIGTTARLEAGVNRSGKAMAAAEARAGRLTRSLSTQAQTFGMSSRQVKIHRLAQEGAKRETIDNLRALDRQVDRLEQEAAAQRRASRITEQALSPKRRHARAVAELNDHLRAGRIDQRTYRHAVRRSADETRRATANVRRHSGALRGFGGGLTGIVRRARLAGVVTAGLAVGGLAAMTAQGLKNADSLAKQADLTGIQTERLAGLRLAADETGAGQEKLDAGLATMAKRLGEAARGSGAAKDALSTLGLSADELLKLSPDQAFARIADAVNDVDEPMQRVALTANIFSKGNADLVRTLALGSDGLDRMTDDADKLGLSLSRVDAAKTEAANDAIGRVGKLVQGVGQTVAVQLAPFITEAANRIVAFGTDGNRATKFVIGGVEALTVGVARAMDGVTLIRAGIVGFESAALFAIGGVIKGWAQFQKFLRPVHEGLIDIGTTVVELFSAIPGIEFDGAALSRSLKDARSLVVEGADDVADGFLDRAGERLKTAGNLFDDALAGRNSQAAAEFFEDVRANADRAAQAVADAAEERKNLNDAITRVQTESDDGAIDAGRGLRDELDAALERVRSEHRRVEESRRDLRQRAEEQGVGLQRSGSAQAQLDRFRRESGQTSQQREQARLAREQTTLQAEMTALLGQIAANTETTGAGAFEEVDV